MIHKQRYDRIYIVKKVKVHYFVTLKVYFHIFCLVDLWICRQTNMGPGGKTVSDGVPMKLSAGT